MADNFADLSQPSYVSQEYGQYLSDAINWTNYVSEGRLNASNPQSVINYLLQALTWCKREIDLEVESLPTAGVLTFLDKVAGVKRSLGTKSRATVEVTLNRVRNGSFTLEQGYPISTYDNKLTFRTVEDLIMPPGAITGTVAVEADKEGIEYNVPAYTINRVFLEYADVQSIQNIEDAQGGSDPETEEEAVQRGSREIRRRDKLTSVDDIEDFVVEQIGIGSSAKVIEWYDQEGSNLPGEVEIYVLDNQGQPINNALRTTLQSQIKVRMDLGIYPTVRPMKVKGVDCLIHIVVEQGVSPESIADELYNIFKVELSSAKINAGDSISLNRLIAAFQSNPSINKLEYIILNNEALDVLMPNKITIAYPKGFIVKIADTAKVDYGSFYYGEGNDSE